MNLITKTLAFILICFLTTKLQAQIDTEKMALFFAEGYSITELEFLIDNMPLKKHEKWMEKRGYIFREEIPSKRCLVYKKGEVVTFYIFLEKEFISEIRVSSSPQKFYQAVDTFSKTSLFRLTKTLKKISFTEAAKDKYWRNKGYVYYANADNYVVGIFRDYPFEMQRKISRNFLPEMVYVKGGSFNMGSNNAEDPADTKPAFSAMVGDFNIGQYEVTVKQFRYFCTETKRKMPSAPLVGWQEDYPIRNITWDDALDYCYWLSYVTGKKYRLPSEAEWEYAARGGQKTKKFIYAGSDFLEKVGWTFKKNEVVMKRIGSTYPNELEIYDMSSNVFEWTNDWYNSTWYESRSKNPVLGVNYSSPSVGTQKVIRGGSSSETSKSRVIYRGKVSPSSNFVDLGFRVVLEED
ncbi:SUMF1/EgtB/PvdO family nonheme iron enzyme [Sediminibacterium sp.]|uniref:formylglycine-generating enzyme family protein n=1 Tax=Sediminibacterium sp. TaxID=1917865 RepID=UPI0027368C15|nr:SUMF1/EgtB/PvdO family nonheme iron enzyme [Sediminibacterium sp.]MDP3394080.1 SUMF1/EgtB/PvdO family nonheme iron enzyme [Sediminibacterium sp.]MDP3566331.1 SUMF1/EgtB/PvdO family nonheme iron enzyme [Sediminibacterium sp.]